MANRKRTVEIEVVADDKKARATLNGLGNEAKTTGGKFSDAGKLISGAMTGVAAAAVFNFAKEAVMSFSNLEQAVGGTEAVFGENADAIDKWAQDAAKNFGLSEAEARNATTSIGGQLKRMTGDVDFAAEHSKELVAVAADLAATYGGTTAEAVQALGAAFRGEADPAERFNLNLKISEVNAKAVELGLAKTTSEVDENAKAQATLALIMEQSADAQGQFAREADSLAGSMQILNAQIEDGKAAFGELLAPAVASATDSFSDYVTIITTVIDKSKELGGPTQGHLGSVIKGLVGMVPIVGQAVHSWDSANRVLDHVAGSLEETEAAEKEVTSATADLSRGMDVARHRTRDAADATRDLTDAYKEAADPTFALWKSTQRVRDAQKGYTEAVIRHGQKSPQATQAAIDLAEAQGDLSAAASRFKTEGGAQSIDALIQLARRAGLSEDAIADLIRAIERLNSTPISGRHVSDVPGGGGGDQEFASGGVVQGTPGSPQAITAHAGELVLTAAQAAAGGGAGGGPIIVQLVVDSRVLMEQVVVPGLQRYRGRGGLVPS